MNDFKYYYNEDMARYNGKYLRWSKKFHYYHRKAQTTKNKLLQLYYRYRFNCLKAKKNIELSYKTSVGKGFALMHPRNVIITNGVTLGDYCILGGGVVLGNEFRGIRKGVPTLGNKVYVGINAVIVGNVKIGDDVLIAPNTFVNCDVPSHSIVFGNPCIIKHRDNATEGYITV